MKKMTVLFVVLAVLVISACGGAQEPKEITLAEAMKDQSLVTAVYPATSSCVGRSLGTQIGDVDARVYFATTASPTTQLVSGNDMALFTPAGVAAGTPTSMLPKNPQIAISRAGVELDTIEVDATRLVISREGLTFCVDSTGMYPAERTSFLK